MDGRRRRSRVEPTDEWEQLALLCGWPEQLAYEEIRPLTLFGASVAERAVETGAGERTLYRRLGRSPAADGAVAGPAVDPPFVWGRTVL